MLEIATFIVSNPNAAVSFLAVLLAAFLGYLLYRQWEKRSTKLEENFSSAEARFTIQSKSMENYLAETRRDLTSHRDDLGKASKAIAGDMLKVNERIFDLKQEISNQVGELRKFTSEIHRTMVLAHDTSKIAIESLNEKLGRIIIIENKIATFEQLITKVQHNGGQNTTDILKHRAWFADVGKTLAAQKTRLETLEQQTKRKP